MTLELATRSRLRAARARRFTAVFASSLLVLIALTTVLPAAVGLSIRTVTDDAMSGTMDKGSAVIVDSMPVADLQVGDVIIYPSPPQAALGTLLTRRIAEIDAGVFYTSGDDTEVLDPWTLTLSGSTQETVVGHVPYAGYAVDALDGSLREWLAGALAILIAAVALAGLMATRREEARIAAVQVGVEDSEETSATNVRVPAPRHPPQSRHDSTV